MRFPLSFLSPVRNYLYNNTEKDNRTFFFLLTMSVRAVGWLQSKLGLDIGGRGIDDDGSERTDTFDREELAGFASTKNRSSSADPVVMTGVNGSGAGVEDGTLANVASQWEAKLGRMWRQANEKATQFWNTNVRSGGRGGDRSNPLGLGSGGGNGDNNDAGENPELDENGLPVTRNWYFFDPNLGRWTVSADAPQSVQREYYEQLEEAERERLGQKTVVAPPPPPPPMGSGAVPRPIKSGAPPPPPGTRAAPGGLFGAGGARGGQGPQYAVPDYFGTNTTPPPYAGGYAPAPQPPSQQHLAATSFPPPPPSAAMTAMAGPGQSGYASNSPYSGTPGTSSMHSSPYPPASFSAPQSQRPPLQAKSSPPPPPPTKLSGYGALPYPSSAAAPSATNTGVLPPPSQALFAEQQPHAAHPASQTNSADNHHHGSARSSESPYPTSNAPSLAPAMLPKQASNSHFASGAGPYSHSASLQTQGSSLGSLNGPTPPMRPSSCTPAPSGYRYVGPVADSAGAASTASGAASHTHSTPPITAWQSQSLPQQAQQQQTPQQPQPQAPPSAPPQASAPAPRNPFAQGHSTSASTAAAAAAPPPAPAQSLPAPAPNAGGYLSGNTAPATAAPAAARLPPPPSFKPFSVS